jgi:uncharacterized protein (TIRG00374 family)
MASKKKTITIVVGIISSGIFGYLSLRNFNWEVLRQMLGSIQPLPYLISCLLWIVVFSLRAYRWRFFLPPEKRCTFGSRFSGVVLGFFFNIIFPMRVGDLIRPVYLVKANPISYKVGLYSILLERVYEVIILIIFILILLKLVSIPEINVLSIDLNLLIAIALLGMIFLFYARRILVVLQKLSFKLQLAPIAKMIGEIIEAFEMNFRFNFKRTIALIVLTAAIIFTDGLIYLFIIDSLSIQIPFVANFLVMLITAISFLLPSAPGAVGVFHYFCHIGLIAFGVDGKVALSSAIVIHATYVAVDLLAGFLCLIFGPLRLKSVKIDLESTPE